MGVILIFQFNAQQESKKGAFPPKCQFYSLKPLVPLCISITETTRALKPSIFNKAGSGSCTMTVCNLSHSCVELWGISILFSHFFPTLSVFTSVSSEIELRVFFLLSTQERLHFKGWARCITAHFTPSLSRSTGSTPYLPMWLAFEKHLGDRKQRKQAENNLTLISALSFLNSGFYGTYARNVRSIYTLEL